MVLSPKFRFIVAILTGSRSVDMSDTCLVAWVDSIPLTCLGLKRGSPVWSPRLLMGAMATSGSHNSSAIFQVLEGKLFQITNCWSPIFNVIVSLTYSCEAENSLSRGLPNKASHAPWLGNILNDPLALAPLTTMVPVMYLPRGWGYHLRSGAPLMTSLMGI